MQKIVPFLWFDHQAEEAANFYTSLFTRSKAKDVRLYGDAGPGPKGTVMTLSFELEGETFHALNGGPHFKLTPAISLFVTCPTVEEVDRFFLAPIWFQGSRLWLSAASVIASAARFSRTFVRVFSRAIGL